MKRYTYIILFIFAFPFQSCENTQKSEVSGSIDYVNALIGTNSNRAFSHGNTYPAVARPWGMNFWTPKTALKNDPWIYTYQSDSIRGFKQTHLPSPWIGDYGSFTIMPISGDLKPKESERSSRFFHSQEKATPYCYSVNLYDHQINAELAATDRCGYLRFTFNNEKDRYIILDAFGTSGVKIDVEKNRITGYNKNNSGGVPSNFCNYFVIEFDTPFQEFGVWNPQKVSEGQDALEGANSGAYVKMDNAVKTVNIRVSSSYISQEQAELTLKMEISNKQFDEVRDEGKAVWQAHLDRIQVEGGTEEQQKTFYSNLYRTSLYPRKFYELKKDGTPYYFSVFDGKVHDGYMFADNGFWDTFRAAHPFYTLVYPELTEQLMQALVSIYEQGGWLPNWFSPGYRDSMIGAHAVSLINDAYSKGITNFDVEKAFEAVMKETTQVAPRPFIGRYGVEEYNSKGFIPYPEFPQAVAMTLEYAYDDFCAMRLAEQIGRADEAKIFASRASNYKNVFDISTSFMRPRMKDGNWHAPFDPYRWGGPYTEGNAVQYSWSVLHDANGLKELMGGKEKFVTMLDSVFTRSHRFSLYSRSFNEIGEMHKTGLGQYAHGNQPAQHIVYLYSYVGESWKTQYWVRKVMNSLYNSTQNAYCGDEDNGQTSAWYLFGAMGFYPVCPGTSEYILGSPLFNTITINLANGNKFVIDASNNSEYNSYVKRLKLNEQDYTKLFLRHEDIVKGGKITFEMTDTPVVRDHYSNEDYPYSLSNQITEK